MIDKKDKDHEEFKDNYGDLIEKLWVDLEIDKEPCGCVTCTLHRGTWCERIMRQRRINSPIIQFAITVLELVDAIEPQCSMF